MKGKSARWHGMFRGPTLLLCLLALLWSVPSPAAPPTPATWVDGTGVWSNPGNWDIGTVPSGNYNVFITDGTSAVTGDGNFSVVNLTLATGNSLTFDLNTQFNVSGPTVSNAGAITLNGGSGTNSYLILNGNTTLQGGGTITLSTGGGGGSTYIEQGVGGVTLTNVDNTIMGNGIIGNSGLALSNAGTINANVSGQALILNGSGGITNTKLIEATSGGVLQLSGVTVNNAGGNITANSGSTVQLFGGTVIQGGTLNALNGGVLGTPQGNIAYLDGSTASGAITINGTYTSALNTDTYLRGTFNNNGNVQVNGGSGTNSYLILNGNTTLQGGGMITLATGGGGGNAYIEQGVGGLTLTNVDNTIMGNGIIGNGGLALSNAGTINANVSGQALTLNGSGGITNTKLIEATNGGVLQLSSVAVNNAGGNITANSGSTVQLFGSTVIQGGTLNNNGGVLGTPQGNAAYLDGSTASGAITINGTYTSDLNTDTYLLGTINNNKSIQLNGGSGTNSALLMGGGSNPAVTLQGGGTVNLSTASGGGNAYLEQAVGGVTLTNVNNTIQGEGIIGNNGLTLVNQSGGTINANSTGGPLTTTLALQGLGLTNQGLLEATNNGLLQLNGITVNNAGANITANGPGASVQLLSGTVIQGGTLNNNGGAFFGTPGGYTAYLDGSTASGAITINGTYTSDLNTNTYLLGTINNNKSIQLNGGSGTNSSLLMGGSSNPAVTLQGGGTVNLSSASGGGAAYIQQSVGGVTLTNVNNTIQGEGIIGNNGLTLVNQSGGTINANSTGGPLTTTLALQGLGLTNQGLLEATNNGVVQLNGITVNNAGGNITANGPGASVQLLSGTVIQGGTLNNNGGAFFGTPGGYTAYLDGSTAGAITINGTYTSDLNTDTYLLGTINNKGSIQLNGGSGYNSSLILYNNTALQGGGTLIISTAGGGGSAYIQQAVGGVTLTNVDNTIQGAGVIGQNGLALINQAKGAILANVSGQTLTLNGGGNITNNGTLSALNGGTLVLNNAVQNNGTVSALISSAVYVNNTYTQAAGGQTVVNGSLFASNLGIGAGILSGTGTVFGNVTVSGTGTVHPGNSPGVLTISGNYASTSTGTLAIDILNLTGAGTGNSQLQVTGTGALGGTVQIAFLSTLVVTAGQEFDILHAIGGLNGTTFAALTGRDASFFTAVYTPTDVLLQANQTFTGSPVPLPPSLLLLAPGLVGLMGRRWLVKRKK